MKRNLIRLIALIINESGINVLKQPNYQIVKFVVLYVPLLCACFMIAVLAIMNFDDFDKFVIPITYETMGINLISNLFTMYYYRQIIGEILIQMDDNLYTYPDENFIFVEYPEYLREESIIKFVYMGMLVELFTLIMIFSPAFIELIFFHEINNLAYPCWTPWKQDSFKGKLFTLMFQLFQGCGTVWLNYIVLVCLLFEVFEFLRQFERLTTAVRSLKQRTQMITVSSNLNDKKQMVSNEVIFNTIMKNNIVNCIRHHQKLFENFQLFKKIFSKLFSLELAVCMLTFLFGFYCIAHAASFGHTVNYFAFAGILNVNVLMKCFIGEIFSDLNYNLANTLFYDIDWREMSTENRRLLVIFHRIIGRPFDLFGFSVIQASRMTFAKIIRVTYSSFNIMNASIKKQK